MKQSSAYIYFNHWRQRGEGGTSQESSHFAASRVSKGC